MLSEYLPPQNRGRFLVFLDFFWPVGLLLATGLSWVFLDQIGGDSGWRYLFLAASFPAFLAFFARLNLPESPYWLARNGRRREAAEVLEQITGRPVSADELTVAEEPRGSLRELVSEKLGGRSAMIVLVWIALNISYYGLFLWLPFVLAGREGLHGQRLPPARPLRALAVPGLRRLDLARGADRAASGR